MTKPIKWDVQAVKGQIAQLLSEYPELAEDEILRADMLEGETDLQQILIQLERKRHDARVTMDAIDEYSKELGQRYGRFEAREWAMRKLMFNLLQAADLRKVELPEATLSIRLGQSKVVIIDEDQLPDDVVRIKREPDRQKIKQAIIEGRIVRGAELSNAEDILAIRTK